MSVTPTFSGEVQFRRYSDTSTQGQQIVLAVADREALAPFIGKEGKRFMAVLVEIGDDEQPVQPVRASMGPLCREAVDLCRLREFWDWANTRKVDSQLVIVDEASARAFILHVCKADSRRELDKWPDLADFFINYIRIPFMKWKRAQQ